MDYENNPLNIGNLSKINKKYKNNKKEKRKITYFEGFSKLNGHYVVQNRVDSGRHVIQNATHICYYLIHLQMPKTGFQRLLLIY